MLPKKLFSCKPWQYYLQTSYFLELNILIQNFQVSWVLALNRSFYTNAGLIVIIRPKKLENRLHTDVNTDWLEDTQLDTKTNKKSSKTNRVCCQCWYSRYRVSVLSTKCGVYHPKGLIVASLNKITIIIITLFFTRQFSFLLDKKKKSTQTHKNPGNYLNFDSLARKILKVASIFSKLFRKLHLKELFSEWSQRH